MFEAMVIGFALQVSDATPITTRHQGPAREVSLNQTSTCGDLTFEVSYTQTRSGIVGEILVKDGSDIVRAEAAQSQVFDKLEYIDDTSVACGNETLPSLIFVRGVEKGSGIVDQQFRINYLSSDGFSEAVGPQN